MAEFVFFGIGGGNGGLGVVRKGWEGGCELRRGDGGIGGLRREEGMEGWGS